MKKYIIGRLIRSVVSIMAVVSIAMILIFCLMDRNDIFEKDGTLTKLGGKPDESIAYKYSRWEELGYLEYANQAEMCRNESDNYDVCMMIDSEESLKVKEIYESKGYTVTKFKSGMIWAARDFTPFELIFNFYKNLIKIDSPSFVNDELNPNLDRGIYFGTDHNGIPAIKCSGCENQYLLYVNTKFPFIHQNFIKLNFGVSFPTHSGLETLDVINSGQGKLNQKEVVYETGLKEKSAVNLHACKYKLTSTLDRMDKQRFETNYADCAKNYEDASMVGTSYIFGILSLILAYCIAIPSGITMAQKKDKWQDKLGLIYINFMISVPSLAFIYFFERVGSSMGFPNKFPIYGAGDVRSYVLPVVILGLMSTAGTMTWLRRYMVDQSNSDYVKFARAKGLTQKEIFSRHILKNAIIPIVNGIPSSIVLCISGAVITETVFAIPGMGKMLPDAINAHNNTMIITLTFIFTALSIFSLLAGDILMSLVDPRIQLSSKGETR